MSSSHERGRIAEEEAKKWLEQRFNTKFSKKELQVGQKSNGDPALHSFDLVSENNQIIGEVKSHQLTISGNNPSGKIQDTYGSCLMLEKIQARKKLLLLTDEKFYKLFSRYSGGKISKDIEIVFIKQNLENNIIDSKPTQQKEVGENEKNFEAFWLKMSSDLLKKKTIKNWTLKNGEIGEDFSAEYKGGNYIIISPKDA
jgi:hypothetical protein